MQVPRGLMGMVERLFMSITPDSREYPPLLREVPDKPSRLYMVNPIIDWGSAVPIAIAGTREPTPYGADLTRNVVKALVDEGFKPIVTGGARGIDSVALRTATAYGETGVKVLPCISLNESVGPMIEKVSEHMCNGDWQTRMSGWLVTRNRITVGMSYALVVTEVKVSNPEWRRYGVACCGTYHAVEYAIQYKRPVYIIIPRWELLSKRYYVRWFEEAFMLITNAGAESVGDVDELIKELKQAVKR